MPLPSSPHWAPTITIAGIGASTLSARAQRAHAEPAPRTRWCAHATLAPQASPVGPAPVLVVDPVDSMDRIDYQVIAAR